MKSQLNGACPEFDSWQFRLVAYARVNHIELTLQAFTAESQPALIAAQEFAAALPEAWLDLLLGGTGENGKAT